MSAAPLADRERRGRLLRFAAAADACAEAGLAAEARRLAGRPLGEDEIRALAQRVEPPAVPDGLSPKALDHGARPATEEEARRYELAARLYQAALDLRELRRPGTLPRPHRWFRRPRG